MPPTHVIAGSGAGVRALIVVGVIGGIFATAIGLYLLDRLGPPILKAVRSYKPFIAVFLIFGGIVAGVAGFIVGIYGVLIGAGIGFVIGIGLLTWWGP